MNFRTSTRTCARTRRRGKITNEARAKPEKMAKIAQGYIKGQGANNGKITARVAELTTATIKANDLEYARK